MKMQVSHEELNRSIDEKLLLSIGITKSEK